MVEEQKLKEGQMTVDDSPGKKDDSVVSSAIGKQLKKLYDNVAEEPVPDRFTDLLKRLEEQENNTK